MSYKVITSAAFILISLLGFKSLDNNDFDYKSAWKKVEQHIEKQRPQSALEEIEKIYKQAQQENNSIQKTKAIIYRGKMTIRTEENGVELVIENLESEIKEIPSPFKQILQSNLAKFHQNYFNVNRYKISQRIEINAEEDSNVRTMSTQSFVDKINDLYYTSLIPFAELKIPISELEDLIESDYNEAGLSRQPYLVDVLIERVLDYLERGELRPTLPNDQFNISNSKFYSTVQEFSNLKLDTIDTRSPQYRSLDIFQRALSLHDSLSTAGIAMDFKRLKYVHRFYVGDQKEILYLNALKKLINRSENSEEYSTIAAEIAQVLSYKDDFKSKEQAVAWCKKGIEKYPKSNGAISCHNTMTNLQRVELNVTGKEAIPERSPMTFKLNYKNTPSVNYQIKSVDKESFRNTIFSRTELASLWDSKAKSIGEGKIQLKDTAYLNFDHNVELPALTKGMYIIRFQDKLDQPTVSTYLTFTVTNLAFVSIQNDERPKLIVTNRTSGAPAEGVNVTYHQFKYDQNKRKNIAEVAGASITDKNGITIPVSSQRSLYVALQKDGDYYLSSDQIYFNQRNYTNDRKSVELYTDRAIYRPGQIIYYKGLVLNYENGIPSIVTNSEIEVILRDANYQEVYKTKFTTNEFGTFNGSFTVPTGSLTGSYQIQTPFGGKSISIEEYKRPTFEVLLDTLKESFVLGDSIKINGTTKGYAGQNITDATVKYTVYRQLFYPRFCYYFPYPQDREVVTSGETTTNENGKFEVWFQSKKENTKNIRGINYAYSIEVDVIDPTGESRSANGTYSFLDAEYTLSVNGESNHDLSKNEYHFNIQALNSNQIEVDASGTYKLYALKQKSNDVITEMAQGLDYSKWEEDDLIETGDFKSSADNTIRIPSVGLYKLKATSVDKNGVKIETEFYIQAYDSKKSKYPMTSLLFIDRNQSTYQPGDQAKVSIGTSMPTTHVYYILSRKEEVLEKGWLKIKKNKDLTFPIHEKDRGGLQLMMVAVKDNQPFVKTIHLAVPWTNKELDITFNTFRDKLEPGQKEKYSILIKSKNGKVSESEILMAMYDASLDQFASNYWRSGFYQSNFSRLSLRPYGFNQKYGQRKQIQNEKYKYDHQSIQFPRLINFENYYGYGGRHRRFAEGGAPVKMSKSMMDGAPMEADAVQEEMEVLQGANDESILKSEVENTNDISNDSPPISPRQNLNETVFFYPTIHTDSDGNAEVEYTINEALTKWKLMTFAHTKDLKIGYDERTITTTKDVIIIPNSPRFIRLGDEIWFTAKVSNLTGLDRAFQAQLHMFDDVENNPVQDYIVDEQSTVGILKGGETIGCSWKINMPKNINLDLIRFQVQVVSGNKSDAEQNYLPVLSNKFLVTETMVMSAGGNSDKLYQFESVKKSDQEGRINKRYTVEYTANPIWFAIQALPYLSESKNVSTINLINQYFGNKLGADIIEKNPMIEDVFTIWKNKGSEALKSSLQKNEELKTLLLQETPWVMDAIDEANQKLNIALFFDKSSLSNNLSQLLTQIHQRQNSDGGFPWIPGGQSNLSTTLVLLESIGKLKQLQINDQIDDSKIKNALVYADEALLSKYNKLKERNKNLEQYIPSFFEVNQLLIRSYFENVKYYNDSKKTYEFYTKQAIKHWNKMDIYSQAILGQYLVSIGEPTYVEIKNSMMERSVFKDDLGRYWNEGSGYNWHQMPIERHTAILDFLLLAGVSEQTIDELKIWLLKNKQVNNWKTTKATAAAVYTLLQKGSSKEVDLKSDGVVTLHLGGKKIDADTEAGTGYFKQSYLGDDISPKLGSIRIENSKDHITWGGAYYQYLDEAEKIVSDSKGPLSIEKEIYKLIQTDSGEELIRIDGSDALKPGDVVVSRMIVKSDRDMQYIDIKDMRGSGMESYHVMSRYHWKSGLSYYHSIRDISDNYFIEYLPKGTHVFEQKQKIVHRGKYSLGIATIQSSYAPEFSSHSKGFVLQVE